MAVTAGMLFIAALFFIPFLGYIPPSAIAPVIIITGTMMMFKLQYVKFNDFTEWFPVLLLVMMITFSGSISTGLAFGFIMYPLMKVFAGKARQVHPLVYALGLLFLVDLFSDFQ
jgi:AGZA family xanthine/uracil permease-like MFS transporter